MKAFASHGTGNIDRTMFAAIGVNVVFEAGAMVFHPEKIELGENIYIGHYSILKGYYKNEMRIGNNVWIGQHSFLHSAGGLVIGSNVGIGPGVKIITSFHREEGWHRPIMNSNLEFAAVTIGSNSDIGVGATILPGVNIGSGVQIGAGAVVTIDIPDYSVAAGVPARIVRQRLEKTC